MRVKRGTVSRARHNKLHERVKGFRGTQRSLIKTAKQASLHADAYAFHGRKLRKRNFRTLWITRISEAVKKENLSYSKFINLLKKSNVMLDRKIISDLIVNDPVTFKQLLTTVQNSK